MLIVFLKNKIYKSLDFSKIVNARYIKFNNFKGIFNKIIRIKNFISILLDEQ